MLASNPEFTLFISHDMRYLYVTMYNYNVTLVMFVCEIYHYR
jgi:hypothetical protein